MLLKINKAYFDDGVIWTVTRASVGVNGLIDRTFSRSYVGQNGGRDILYVRLYLDTFLYNLLFFYVQYIMLESQSVLGKKVDDLFYCI